MEDGFGDRATAAVAVVQAAWVTVGIRGRVTAVGRVEWICQKGAWVTKGWTD